MVAQTQQTLGCESLAGHKAQAISARAPVRGQRAMARYTTRKATDAGKRETLRRKAERARKYNVPAWV